MADIFDEVNEDLRAERAKQFALRYGWLAALLAALLVGGVGAWQGWRWYHGRQVKLLERHWRLGKPDMVISLIPNFNRAMQVAARQVMPQVPFVTILTDMADYPPHFWIERQEQYLICGTAKAKQQGIGYL